MKEEIRAIFREYGKRAHVARLKKYGKKGLSELQKKANKASQESRKFGKNK